MLSKVKKDKEEKDMRWTACAIATAVPVLLFVCVPTASANTDTVYVTTSQYFTGYCTSTPTKIDDTIRWDNGWMGLNPVMRGWAKFDLRNLPRNPTSYAMVKLHFFVVQVHNTPATTVAYIPYVDPYNQGAQSLLDSLNSLGKFPVYYNIAVDTGTGVREYVATFPAWNLWPPNYPVSTQYWTFSWLSNEASAANLQFGEADGYGPPSGRQFNTKPFLEFIAP